MQGNVQMYKSIIDTLEWRMSRDRSKVAAKLIGECGSRLFGSCGGYGGSYRLVKAAISC